MIRWFWISSEDLIAQRVASPQYRFALRGNIPEGPSHSHFPLWPGSPRFHFDLNFLKASVLF